MVSAAVQLLSCVLCAVALCALLSSTCMTEWKVIARANGDTAPQKEFVGLWKRCSTGAGDTLTCTPFTSILHQPLEINVSRALMICSIIFCALALLVTIPGLQCTNCLDGNEQMKSKTAMVGGGLSIFGGLCAFGLICWYAYNVTKEFQGSGLVKYEFGQALFVGGTGGLLSIIGGILLCVGSKPENRFRSYPDKSSVSERQATDYV
ncbi:claudin-7 [Hoplias malabaricus]|uniref:claudin-7 n=1 Tax=Hoplias malabaricus TaxID=27720 RepID=UPI003461AE32